MLLRSKRKLIGSKAICVARHTVASASFAGDLWACSPSTSGSVVAW